MALSLSSLVLVGMLLSGSSTAPSAPDLQHPNNSTVGTRTSSPAGGTPEPVSALLVGGAAAGYLVLRRRRKVQVEHE